MALQIKVFHDADTRMPYPPFFPMAGSGLNIDDFFCGNEARWLAGHQTSVAGWRLLRAAVPSSA